MNNYLKMLIIGITGFVVWSIVFGITQAPAGGGAPTFELGIDPGHLVFLFLFINESDPTVRLFLIILFLLGFFTWQTSE